MIRKKLPDIESFVQTYLGIDPSEKPIPIQPTAHYAMGGIPTDVDGRVVSDEKNTPLPGFYAAGECACVSVHGANRLGTNSLVDILVFGRRAALHMARTWARSISRICRRRRRPRPAKRWRTSSGGRAANPSPISGPRSRRR